MLRKYFLLLLTSLSIVSTAALLFAGTPYHIVDPESIKGIFTEKEPDEKMLSIKKESTFDTEKWNNIRRLNETGGEYSPEVWKPYKVVSSTETASQTQAGEDKVKRAFDVELAYESGLSIQGRKTIDVKFSQKKFLNKSETDPDRKDKINSFDMEQTLRVDIQGKVGRKITVDVHFDDTQENKRDISVVYKGDPDEFVQEAAFGDITLSLPQTQFVNYNKQVFGIKADLKYKRARFMAIGSRTKGITETKVFTGSTRLIQETLRDTGYVQRKYYKPFHADIKRDTIKIWRDDQIATNNVAVTTMTAESFTAGLVPNVTGYFDELKSGVDFSFDPISNVITFRNSIDVNHVVIIDYQRANNTWLHDVTAGTYQNGQKNKVILKDKVNTDAVTPEMKNYYRLKNNKIIRDNFRGNFTFQVQDLDKTIPGALEPGSKLVPQYPGKLYVDFDSGIFYFRNAEYDFSEFRPFPDDVYSSGRNRYNIFIEYYAREKDYSLRANIVPGSERVVLDGKVLTKDVDYFIIYEIGQLTFYNEDQINDYSKIEITYEWAPFGGQFGQTLVGSRLELSPIDHLFIGSSVLYNFSAKPAQVPDMSSQPDSTMVWGVDSRLEDIQFGDFPFAIKSVKGEFAQSIYNPNIYGKAIVESMEGIKQDNTLSLGEDFWLRASNPNLSGSPSGSRMQYSAVTWTNLDVKTSEIYLGIGASAADIWWEEEDEQQVLAVNYDFTRADADEVSMVQVMSRSGNDYSERLFLEVIYYDTGNGERLTFDLGEVSEDADGDGLFENEDTNNNGTLDKGEDVGWGFSYPGMKDVPIEENNGRIDKEDLNGDGIFNSQDVIPIKGRIQIDSRGYAGWRYIAAPLNIDPSEIEDWKNIKHLRLIISNPGSAPNQGTIRIARIGIVGNRNDLVSSVSSPGATSNLVVSAVNNQDNPGYDSLLDHPVYGEIYPDAGDRKKEQALQIAYEDFEASTDGSVTIGLGSADFTRHRKLKFFMYNNDNNKKDIYIRFGTASSYFEFEINISENAPKTWELYEVIMDDLTGDDVADRMIYGNTSRKGQQLAHPSNTIPSLKNVSTIIIGVRNVTGSGSFLVNEFYVDTAVKQVGHAATMSGDFEVPGWLTFGGAYNEKDRNFRTIASAVTGQDSYDESGKLSFSRLKWMPMSASASKSKTKTPSALETGESGLISVQEEGEVVKESVAGNTSILIPKMPQLTGDVSRTLSDSSNLKRKDINESASGGLTYSNPIQTPILHLFPTSISAKYTRNNYKIQHDSQTVSNIDSLEFTDTYSGALVFTPWKNFSVKPKYDLTTTREIKYYTNNDQAESINIKPGESREVDIPKSLKQTVRGNVNITLLRWLQPTADYSYTVNANYDITVATSVTTKTVDRQSSGKVNWVFQPRSFYGLGGFTPVKSMSLNASYSINDGDSYEKIPRAFNIQNSIWVRKPLQKEYTQYDLFTSTAGIIDIFSPRRKSLTTRDTHNYSAKWNPFDWMGWLKGPAGPIKSINTTSTLNKSNEKTDNTGTITEVVSLTWPNIDVSMSNLEEMLFVGWMMQNMRLNGKTYKKIVETINKSETIDKKNSGNLNFKFINYFDTYLTYEQARGVTYDITPSTVTDQNQRIRNSLSTSWSRSAQTSFSLGVWRFTPSYSDSNNKAIDRKGNPTTDKTTMNASLKIRGDLHKPKNFVIPFTTIGFKLNNRLVLDTSFSWDTTKSPELNVTQDNTDTGKFSISADYTLSSNLRIQFGLSGTMFRNREKKEDDYDEYAGNAGLSIEF